MFGLGSNKFDPNEDIPNLSGKVFVVTGGSAGIGFGICAHILQHKPEALYLLGNKEEHLAEAEEKLKEYGDTSVLHPVQIDLKDLRATDRVAHELASRLQRIDALVCNAGLGVGSYDETVDKLDSHMQVNFISQFHLAMVLMPLLQRTSDSRLVLQASNFHNFISDVHYASVEEINTDIGGMKLYARTKLAQILFVKAIAARKSRGELGLDPSPEVGPWFIATHPGGVKTDQPDQAVDAYGTMGKIGVAMTKPLLKDPVDEGCRPALFAATSDDVSKEKLQGVYIIPDRKVSDVSKQGNDSELGESLWRLTEQILTDKLGKLPYQTVHV